MIRLGIWGARADNTGLGTQTWEFVRHMRPTKIVVIDLAIPRPDGSPSPKQYPERYPGATFIRGFPTEQQEREFLTGIDVAFVTESPYNDITSPNRFYAMAREMGVKTICAYNWEFFDWYRWPNTAKPDMLVAPSLWHFDEMERWAQAHQIRHQYMHVPVNRNLLPHRRIKKAHKFLHMAGTPAVYDRNGTQTVLDMSMLLRDYPDLDIEIVIACQNESMSNGYRAPFLEFPELIDERVSIEFTGAVHNYWTSYLGFDVLILPRRYGGNCLPMNEALSCGMPVIMSNVSPNNDLLPQRWLVPAEKSGAFMPRCPEISVDIYDVKPQALLDKVAEFATLSQDEMEEQSILADKIAQSISWKEMSPRYSQVLESL